MHIAVALDLVSLGTAPAQQRPAITDATDAAVTFCRVFWDLVPPAVGSVSLLAPPHRLPQFEDAIKLLATLAKENARLDELVEGLESDDAGVVARLQDSLPDELPAETHVLVLSGVASGTAAAAAARAEAVEQGLAERVGGRGNVTAITAHTDFDLIPAVHDFMLRHLRLLKIRVSNIPMKEAKDSQGRNKYYEVVLLHRMPVQTASMPKEIRVQWASKRKADLHSAPSQSLGHVTPLDVGSPATTCLMKHVCSGKTVTLAPTASGEPTHILLSISGHAVLYHLRPSGVADLSRWPDTVQSLLHTSNAALAESYRTRQLQSLLKKHTLVQYLGVGTGKKRARMPVAPAATERRRTVGHGHSHGHGHHDLLSSLERQTTVFPLKRKASSLYGDNHSRVLQRLVGDIHTAILAASPSKDAISAAVKAAQTIYLAMLNNDDKYFTPFDADLNQQRHTQLWEELGELAERCQFTPAHKFLKDEINRLSESRDPEHADLVAPENEGGGDGDQAKQTKQQQEDWRAFDDAKQIETFGADRFYKDRALYATNRDQSEFIKQRQPPRKKQAVDKDSLLGMFLAAREAAQAQAADFEGRAAPV